ncbi:antibiotic biosynthesis monooxygenase family protein [Sessilibacter corallicola]|uniref:Antibiotic biosynthesis monooxygenase n=1 Tax=Sessilibacter corallicola TaxID=2904075 RepID=A0ABQ0A7E0_9GAMM
MTQLAETPEPPYYAVIFASIKIEEDQGYAETSARMIELAKKQPGFIGMDSARVDVGVTVSYWQDLASIKQWKQNAEHQVAQAFGREQWYSRYKIRIAKVELEYGN